MALFQYRSAAIAGLFTQFFWAVIKIMIFTAFFSQSTAAQPISLEQAITFIWLGQALLQLLPWTIDKDLEAQVKSGSIAYELLRPLHLYGLFYFKSLAMRSIPTLLRGMPVFILASLTGSLSAPVSWEAGCVFVLSLGCALLLSSAINTLVIISLFWTLSGEGIQRLLPHVTIVLSGMVVPLPLFPDWMQPFLSIQPFRGVIDIPCRIYTGIIPLAEAGLYLGFQLLWFVVLAWMGKGLMRKAVKQFVIQGG
jgi:ABC-2 type transport system permease protein